MSGDLRRWEGRDGGPNAGATHRNARLTAEQRAQARVSDEPHTVLAARFGVSESAVRRARRSRVAPQRNVD